MIHERSQTFGNVSRTVKSLSRYIQISAHNRRTDQKTTRTCCQTKELFQMKVVYKYKREGQNKGGELQKLQKIIFVSPVRVCRCDCVSRYGYTHTYIYIIIYGCVLRTAEVVRCTDAHACRDQVNGIYIYTWKLMLAHSKFSYCTSKDYQFNSVDTIRGNISFNFGLECTTSPSLADTEESICLRCRVSE